MSPNRTRTVCYPLALIALLVGGAAAPQAAPVTLRLQVSLSPQELKTFQPALEALDDAHPEWTVALETVPQEDFFKDLNAQIATGTLPDVIRVPGLLVQQWLRQGVFLDLTDRLGAADLDDFYPAPLEQFRWQAKLWGLPDTAAPELVFYNKAMFDAAGLAYPTDNWTFEEMRRAAIQLTRDANGRTPTDPDFDPDAIVQWGWNSSLDHLWRRHALQSLGADWCVNADCTVLDMTSPEVVAAASWWASLVQEEHAGLHDPYGGSQTGTPGDPVLAGKAAMGFNGYFAVGQLNDSGAIAYDIVQPFLAQDGHRYSVLSTNGYVISAASAHPEEAWALVQALLEADFLAQVWGREGHFVPARQSAAASVLEPTEPPANRHAILDAMAYAEVFKPYTRSAFEAYAQTQDLFARAMRGDLSVAEALEQIETVANEILAQDRDGDMTGGVKKVGSSSQTTSKLP
jgi:multiple sugar transport system substrate-binding protein